MFRFITVIWIVAAIGNVYGRKKKEYTALDILKIRVTKGEISKEEYEEIESILEKN